MALLPALIVAGVIVWIVLAADEDSARADRGVTLNEIVDEPRAFVGRSVTVSGVVAETDVAPAVFTLGEDGRVVVLPRQGVEVPRTVSEGDAVQVQGRVEMVSSELADAETFGFDEDAFFGAGPFDVWEGDPAIVASTIDSHVPPERNE